MKLLYAVVLGLVLSCSALSETQNNQVWGSGGKIYAQATMGSPLMPNHILTTKVRISTKAGLAITNWITKTTNGVTNVNKISIPLPGPGDYKMEAEYRAQCPSGKYFYTPATLITFWRIGYSTNCLYLVPGTQALSYDQFGNPFYVGKYAKTLGCGPYCQVPDGMIFTTAYGKGKADGYISIRYSWLEVLGFFRSCLDWYEMGRNKCSQLQGCGDFAY